MADVKIDKSKWDALSDEEKRKITDGLIKAGTLKSGDNIVGDAVVGTSVQPAWDPVGDICRGACDVAAGVGAAWCTANTVGVGLIACLAAAEAVRNECRNHC